MLGRTETAREAASVGAAVAADRFRDSPQVTIKGGKTDVVTDADRAAETAVLDRIRADYPDATVVAEESAAGVRVPPEGQAWVVDPIDGTNNFVRGVPLWSTAVALLVDGAAAAAAVVAPALGDTYLADEGALVNGEPVTVSDRTDPERMTVAPTVWWPRDRRAEYERAAAEIVGRFGDMVRFRSAQLTLAMVAAGRLDGAFTNLTPNPWDSVAGATLVERAGGTVTDLDGEPWRHDSDGLVASNGRAHGEVLAAANAVEAVAERSRAG